MDVPTPLIEAAYAVGIGLVIGFEREHHSLSRDLGPTEVPARERGAEALEELREAAGARTFAMLALAGWVAAYLGEGQPALFPVIVVVALALMTAHYVLAVRRGLRAGVTTEVAGLVVVLLGALVHTDRSLAVTLGLTVLLLLVAKPWTHGAAIKLRRIEVTATVQLLVLAAIVLPLLPTEPVDPWDAVPPQKVGIFVVLVAALEYVGYVLHRLLGAERGAGVAGLIGGLTSSTAVTTAMARQARRTPAMIAPAQLAVFLANAVMAVRVVVITRALSAELAWRLAPIMAAVFVALVGGAAWRLRRREPDADIKQGELELRNPFAILPAVTLGAILVVVLIVSAVLTDWLGGQGLLVAAAFAGLADVDAITLAASQQASLETMSIELAALAITIAVASNTLVKGGIAVGLGGRRFGLGVLVVFGIAIVAGGIVAVVSLAA